jgi:hypothetical protein
MEFQDGLHDAQAVADGGELLCVPSARSPQDACTTP